MLIMISYNRRQQITAAHCRVTYLVAKDYQKRASSDKQDKQAATVAE